MVKNKLPEDYEIVGSYIDNLLEGSHFYFAHDPASVMNSISVGFVYCHCPYMIPTALIRIEKERIVKIDPTKMYTKDMKWTSPVYEDGIVAIADPDFNKKFQGMLADHDRIKEYFASGKTDA